jgi:hypothetical protein
VKTAQRMIISALKLVRVEKAGDSASGNPLAVASAAFNHSHYDSIDTPIHSNQISSQPVGNGVN